MRNIVRPRLCAPFWRVAPVALPIQRTIIASGANDAARVIVGFKADRHCCCKRAFPPPP
jgi:hypothetical protein